MFSNYLIHRLPSNWLRVVALGAFLGGLGFTTWSAAPERSEVGLAVTIRSQAPARDGTANTDTFLLPQAALYVPAGQAPTPFVPEGLFQATWTGFVSAELRGQYRFQAELSGRLKMAINGTVVLETNGVAILTEPSPSVRLNKGPNLLTIELASPPSGDTALRLLWIPKGACAAPMPQSALAHDPAFDGLAVATPLHLGRALILEHRCVQCHKVSQPFTPELQMDAPAFENIGARRNQNWLADWILDPKKERPTCSMPQVFHGTEAPAQAKAVAVFLASLGGSLPLASPQEVSEEKKNAGAKLFESLHCVACHLTPGGDEVDPTRISLRHVARKFRGHSLTAFLREPQADYHWTRMPNFRLSPDESDQLATWLLANADPPKAFQDSPDPELIASGRRLVQSRGCLNCNRLELENTFKTRPLAELPAASWTRGCLAEAPQTAAPAPFFGFSAVQRQALQAFAATDRSSLLRNVPSDFAARQVTNLNCLNCHGKFEGFPALDLLGEKLKPEWTRAFLAGEIREKPRSWLPARMPGFAEYATGLAVGLAARQGCPPASPPQPPVNAEAAQVGRKLVSADGGLSCISCHAVGTVAAMQVFENAGINFAYIGERLREEYFRRWLRNPLAMDPVSKMPTFFDEELHSPLTDVYGGDGQRQIDAIWQYLRLGRNLPPPPGLPGTP